MKQLLWACLLSVIVASPALADTVLVEAESFADCGGWVVDQQSMDEMGSSYLLAHGLGEPVADATTTVNVPKPGKYRVLVRTRDWVATWKASGAPGKFQVVIGGKTLPTVFGTQGADWHWQDGGQVDLAGGKTKLTLHDLTGFEGRCDAILLTTDANLTPPNADPEMAQFRRRLLGMSETPEASGQFDLVVVGGGIAGTCAAISAARLGLDVALIQDRPVLGGNNSSEVRVWLQGARNLAPFPHVGDIVRELEQQRHAHYGPDNTAELYEDERKIALARAEKNLRLVLGHRAIAVEALQGRIRAVVAQDIVTGRRLRFAGRWFADCTGDGCVGALAKADYESTATGHMGSCNLWNVIDTGKPVAFPRCPWALDLSDKPFPGRDKKKPDILKLGGWYWESGFDHDQIAKAEYIRDWNFRAMYGAWDAMKNVDRVLPNHKLNWAAYVQGKRESRRLIGDVLLSRDDLLNSVEYKDGCVPTGWKIDLHLPDKRYEKGFEGDAFISKADFTAFPQPYWIPYRCLYSRNVANLFMAGRCISVTHEALGAARVMRTGGCMGECVGRAATVCKRHDCDPRDVYANYLDEFIELLRRPLSASTSKPWSRGDEFGENVARVAKISTSGDRDTQTSPATLVNDGEADTTANGQRWLSAKGVPNWVELKWDGAKTIVATRIISGYARSSGAAEPIQDFYLQYHDGHNWQTIRDSVCRDNTAVECQLEFKPVSADRVRLMVEKTNGDISRIWEIELYAPKGK